MRQIHPKWKAELLEPPLFPKSKPNLFANACLHHRPEAPANPSYLDVAPFGSSSSPVDLRCTPAGHHEPAGVIELIEFLQAPG